VKTNVAGDVCRALTCTAQREKARSRPSFAKQKFRQSATAAVIRCDIMEFEEKFNARLQFVALPLSSREQNTRQGRNSFLFLFFETLLDSKLLKLKIPCANFWLQRQADSLAGR